jgi:hypothetical protein
MLMFVAETDEKKTDDENVVKLAKLIDFVVKSYADKEKALGAVIFRGKSYEAREVLEKADLKVHVASFVEKDEKKLEVYEISSKHPVTVVMWTKSAIAKKNIIVWTHEDLETKLDAKGQEMVVQFIGLLQ